MTSFNPHRLSGDNKQAECPHSEIKPVGTGRSEHIAGDCVACKKPLLKTEVELIDGRLMFKPSIYTRPIGKSHKQRSQAAIEKLRTELKPSWQKGLANTAEVAAEPPPNLPPVRYTPDQWWFNCVHRTFLAGCNNVTAPMSELSEKSATDVAVWMKASLLTKGSDYVFSRTKAGTIVDKGRRVNY